MALSANTVGELRTTGADTNGGGFVTGATGVDKSQQDAAGWALTGLTSSGAGNVVLSASAHADMVGNIAQVISGTNFTVGATPFFQITAVSAGVSITFSTNAAGASICTGVAADGVINIGGALASPGMMGAMLPTNSATHVKAGTYTITSASTNIAGGCVNCLASAWFGYQTTRGDLGTKPIFKSDGTITTFTLFQFSAGPGKIVNIELDGNSRTSSRGFTANGNQSNLWRCNFKNFTNNATSVNASAHFIDCYFTGCATQTVCSSGNYDGCTFSANTISVLTMGTATVVTNSIFSANTGASTDAVIVGSACIVRNVTIHGTGRHGVNSANNANTIRNVIAYANTGTGIIGSTNDTITYCATGGNGTNTNFSTGNRALASGNIALSADPFTSAAGGDFSLNTTAGGGAACRAAGIPGAFPGLSTTTSYPDIGAVQHQASGGAPGFGSPFIKSANKAVS